MKILLSHPSSELYGSDRMMLVTARILSERGHTVYAVLPCDGPLVARLETAGVQVMVVDVPVLRKSDMRPSRLFALVRRVAGSQVKIHRLFKKIQPNLVYVNTIVQPWWILSGALHRTFTVVHVREAENNVNTFVQYALNAPLLLSSKVICNSVATRNQIAAPKGLRQRLQVIYNGKDWSPYSGARDYATEPISGTVRLTVVGRLSPRKGQDIAIHALARLVQEGHDAVLSLAGDVFPGYEWYETELKELATSLGVTNRVIFLGFHEDIRPVLGRTDIALVPSRVEPFGTVAAESMAGGVVTIAADVQGLAEVVKSGETGLLFEPQNADELAAACKWVIVNSRDAEAMAARGAADVTERFSLQAYERKIVEVLEGQHSSA